MAGQRDIGTTVGAVAEIAVDAARQVPGVHSVGATGPSGPDDVTRPGQAGVTVEVGGSDAMINLNIVTWYGWHIVDVTEAVRHRVVDQVQTMTGLAVTEVNITVDDVFVDGVDSDEPAIGVPGG